MGFSAYFLVVSDILSWARSQGILCGPGRGSVVGSLTAYVLNITAIDPIEYNLLFERFLNPSRVSMPDIDMDFQDDKRDLVIEYVTNKYGRNKVGHIATYGTLKCRGAIKAVGRVLGADYEVRDRLSKLTPPPINGVAPKLSACYEQVAELNRYYQDRESIEGKILHWADKIEDRIDHVGTHPSGILISDISLSDVVPIIQDKEGQSCSVWDMTEVEKVGLIKFDFLGLTALTVIARALDSIKSRHQIVIDIDNIPKDDSKVFSNLQNGDTAGIFQAETSGGFRDLMVKMKPKNISDLGMLQAIFRPGPIASDYYEKWLRIRAGLDTPEYLVPELEPALKETDGWLIFQEQVAKICMDLAGYTAPEASTMVKIIGKKLPAEMKLQREKFIGGMTSRGFAFKIAEKLFNDIEVFAGYSFNKAHSIAYAYIMYITAWIKAYYPVEYMCAALTCNKDNTNQVIKYIHNCRELGIKVLPPDINSSDTVFTIDSSSSIRFGLAAIKNLGEDIVHSIIQARTNNPFKGLEDFIARIDTGKVNRRKLESLILSGTMDSFGVTRASMMNMVEQYIDHKTATKSFELKYSTYQKRLEAFNVRNQEIKLASISGIKTKLKPFKDPKRPTEPTVPKLINLPELAEKELFQHERELLGFYVSGHPVDKYKHFFRGQVVTIDSIKSECDNNNIVSVIAIPTSVQERTTKTTNKKMANMLLEDHTGAISATAFPKIWERYSDILSSTTPIGIKCRVSLNETVDAVLVPELLIMAATRIVDTSSTPENDIVDVPLSMDTVTKVHNLLDKYAGKESNISINLLANNGRRVRLPKTYSIRNRSSFMKDLKGIIKKAWNN